MNKGRVLKCCETCGKEFLTYKCWVKRGGGRFCSGKCRARGRWNGEKNPMFDSKRFGSSNPNWRGGITNWRRLIYVSKEYKEWSNWTRAFWNYTCQICGKRGHGDIHANHIKTFNDHPLLRFDRKNGIALCKDCHVHLVNNHEKEWESYFNFCWENKLL